MLIPGPENIGVVVGVLGHYLGMINLPADTSHFPSDLNCDLGRCLVVSDRKLFRCSWRELLKQVYTAWSGKPIEQHQDTPRSGQE